MRNGREVAVSTKSHYKMGLAVLVSHSVAAKFVKRVILFTLFVAIYRKGNFL